MQHDVWFKKDVTLNWQGHRLELGVAQELFSSHDVDAGSRLLLRSLDPASFPQEGTVVDFGCGYGVLGLGWLSALPQWQGLLIDRDVLAVKFAAANAERAGLERASCVPGVGVDAVPPAGADLVLWNVPGKAGDTVIAALTSDCSSILRDAGLLSLVVVNPLADVIRAVLTADPAMSVTHDQTHAEHTIIHAQHTGEPVSPGNPFERGIFDRDPSGFGVDDFDYDLTPVVGLPEYDSYDFATEVTFDILRTVNGTPQSVLVGRPGQGHVPLVAAAMLGTERIWLFDRDTLAIEASRRAYGQVFPDRSAVVPQLGADLRDAAPGAPFDLVVVMLEDQVRNEVHQARLHDLMELVVPGGQVIVGGTSATVSRFLSFAAKAKSWKARDRTRRSGASAARLERVA